MTYLEKRTRIYGEVVRHQNILAACIVEVITWIATVMKMIGRSERRVREGISPKNRLPGVQVVIEPNIEFIRIVGVRTRVEIVVDVVWTLPCSVWSGIILGHIERHWILQRSRYLVAAKWHSFAGRVYIEGIVNRRDIGKIARLLRRGWDRGGFRINT